MRIGPRCRARPEETRNQSRAVISDDARCHFATVRTLRDRMSMTYRRQRKRLPRKQVHTHGRRLTTTDAAPLWTKARSETGHSATACRLFYQPGLRKTAERTARKVESRHDPICTTPLLSALLRDVFVHWYRTIDLMSDKRKRGTAAQKSK